jgi:hypothetical protein
MLEDMDEWTDAMQSPSTLSQDTVFFARFCLSSPLSVRSPSSGRFSTERTASPNISTLHVESAFICDRSHTGRDDFVVATCEPELLTYYDGSDVYYRFMTTTRVSSFTEILYSSNFMPGWVDACPISVDWAKC